jgi:hypothetical protein
MVSVWGAEWDSNPLKVMFTLYNLCINENEERFANPLLAVSALYD